MEIDDKGVQGESFVNELAYSSYLKYWCYPGVKDELGDKKEIADLLILFNGIAIIISVKNYEFKGQYDRYFRRTLEKAVSQIYGAERKLFNNKNKLFIKHVDRKIEEFSPDAYKQVIRVIVNLGENAQFYPSSLLTVKGMFVHVLDKEAFEKIIIELDTIPDLVKYLLEREAIFSGKDVMMLPGEEDAFNQDTNKQYIKYGEENFALGERVSIMILGTEFDLLAKYLENQRSFPEYFNSDYTNMLLELDEAWADYEGREEVKLKRAHDEVSYFVDELVKREILINDDEVSLNLAKELLSLNRFERRVVGQSFFEMVKQYAHKAGNHIGRRHGKIGGILISFAVYGVAMKSNMVNDLLEIALKGYSYFEGYKTKKSILIAVNNEVSQFKIGYLSDVAPFDKEYEELLVSDLRKLNWFVNPKITPYSFKEYPDK